MQCVSQLNTGCVVSGSADKTLIVWAMGDDGTFTAAQTLHGHTHWVYCVVQLDGGRVVSGSADKTLIVWAAGDDGMLAAAQTLRGRTITPPYPAPLGIVQCVVELDDGRVLSGNLDSTLKVWE